MKTSLLLVVMFLGACACQPKNDVSISSANKTDKVDLRTTPPASLSVEKKTEIKVTPKKK